MKLHVFPPSPNARKAIMMNHLLDYGADLVVVDLQAGAQNDPAYLTLNPNGKVPTLEYDDGTTFWESNAMINRMASEKGSDLWPRSDLRYDILRWQFWESCHWTPACARFIGQAFFGQEIDVAEATQNLHRFASVLDDHLNGRDWLVGQEMTTADISVNAIQCHRAACGYPLDGFANLHRWVARIEALEAWKQANPALQDTAAVA